MWLWLTLAACVPEDEAQRRWDAAMEEYGACDAGDTCTLVYPGCPLGCWAVVNETVSDAATRRADRLRSLTAECLYDCAEGPVNLRCEAGRCVGDTGQAR